MAKKAYKHLTPITREWVLSQLEKHGMTEHGSRDRLAYYFGVSKSIISSWLSEKTDRGFKSNIHKAAFHYFFKTLEQQEKIRQLELEIKLLKGEITESFYNQMLDIDNYIKQAKKGEKITIDFKRQEIRSDKSSIEKN